MVNEFGKEGCNEFLPSQVERDLGHRQDQDSLFRSLSAIFQSLVLLVVIIIIITVTKLYKAVRPTDRHLIATEFINVKYT